MKVATAREQSVSKSAARARRKFLRFFPGGFRDETYFAWERGYKLRAHQRWNEMLAPQRFRRLIAARKYDEIAANAIKSLSGTNLLFSFENMALRDAVRKKAGAHQFAEGLNDLLHGRAGIAQRFDRWCEVVASLPKLQSRVLTHPVVTVFGFIAQPQMHIFFKPTVTRTAAERYGFELPYASRPSWEVYSGVLEFAGVLRHDLADLKPRDMIDIQSFIWVIGSSEYE